MTDATSATAMLVAKKIDDLPQVLWPHGRRAIAQAASVLLLIFLGIGVARAQAELPRMLEVVVPGGGTVRVALPPGMCTYPSELRDRLARFLLNGEIGLRLLGVAGDCKGIYLLTRDGKAVVSPSLQLTMLKTEVEPAKRSTPATYRRLCYERFPPKRDGTAAYTLGQSPKGLDGEFTVGETTSLGLLAATGDAVFGGLLAEVSHTPHQLLQVQVVACFAPSGVPLLWTFQEMMNRDSPRNIIDERIRAVLALAQFQVKETMALNRGR